ncbi:dienelactone hydrolase family protein [Sphingosinicella sp. BN140058]|uniref:dienelactone hydrolase family protein n=1 Tax=Sphingosinicella sp. BN140058 TaxID=1892855 RepID=UPI0010138B0A|nr:dienelactone hydrolase family protein [Sphingosinicella sp. BN140058]QAY77637.1 dienelactone hydrolase family protein [Sphingosinicella sp. BN140058]
MIERRTIDYSHDGDALEGLFVFDPQAGPRPTVIVVHTFVGRGPNEEAVAERLAGLGYNAFAADLYGKGVLGTTREECSALMQPFLDDRARLQARMLAVLETVRGLAEVNPARIVAIGYCFGGLCVLDLARTGADLAGVASVHGLFGAPGNCEGTKITAKVVAFHGWDDPMVPPEAVTALGKELTAAGADWQIHAYGGVMHGFTNPKAAAPENGVLYDAAADRRSWASLRLFLEECFA